MVVVVVVVVDTDGDEVTPAVGRLEVVEGDHIELSEVCAVSLSWVTSTRLLSSVLILYTMKLSMRFKLPKCPFCTPKVGSITLRVPKRVQMGSCTNKQN